MKLKIKKIKPLITCDSGMRKLKKKKKRKTQNLLLTNLLSIHLQASRHLATAKEEMYIRHQIRKYRLFLLYKGNKLLI